MSKKLQNSVAAVAAAQRTSKPLAWFLNEQLEKNSMETIMDQQQQEPQQNGDRKCSVDSLASSVNSSKISEANIAKEDTTSAANKKRGKKGGRQRVKKVSVNFTIAGSENKEPAVKTAIAAVEEKQPLQQLITAPTCIPTNAPLLMNPNHANNNNNNNNKERKEDYWYYCSVTDGFYYENNGSRGWKKRNPKLHGPPPPTTVPKKTLEIEKMIEQQKMQKLQAQQKMMNHPGSGAVNKYYDPESDGYFYEMASVDGWRKRQPAVTASSSSATVSSIGSNDRKPMNIPRMHQHAFNNGYYHPYGSFSSTTATPTPSPAGSFMPQPATMTNAQLEEMIVRHPSLVASMSRNRFGNIFDNNEACIPSNSSTTSSEELTSSPPPAIGSSQPEHSLFMQHFRRGQGGNLQQSNSASMLINGGAPSSCQTNTFSVGSADEPYEFDWRSDNEKASSISSYDDMGDKEQSIPRESVIGSGMTKRPNTLSVGQEKQQPSKVWWDANASDHRFDVDKFIADLPSFDEDKILRNLTALPTPLSSQHLQQQNSNLITPMKENSAAAATWWFGHDRTGAAPQMPLPTTTSASKNLEKIDYEKIWRTPCA